MSRLNKHVLALTALLALLVIGWAAAYPMVMDVNTFGVTLGGILPSLLFVASVATALYFAGQEKKGFGRVIAVGVAFAFLFCVINSLLLTGQIYLAKSGVPEAVSIGIYDLLRCATWVFFFWLAINRLTHKEQKANESPNSMIRTIALAIACILMSIPLTVFATDTFNSSLICSILLDIFGLVVWWLLAIACIWRFSFGVVPAKTTSDNVNNALGMPVFRYQPHAYTNGVFSLRKKGDTCPCCGQYTTYYYKPDMHAAYRVSGLCPDCISDGSAAEEFDGVFAQNAEEISDTSKTEELMLRTPGFESQRGEYWLSCCDDYCAFVGLVGMSELKEMGIADEVLTEYMKSYGRFSEKSIREQLDKHSSMVGYLFSCLHCGTYRLWIDIN